MFDVHFIEIVFPQKEETVDCESTEIERNRDPCMHAHLSLANSVAKQMCCMHAQQLNHFAEWTGEGTKSIEV